jgi:hypothetical protein
MLIYLDANIVQYCADYEDFIFGHGALPSGTKARLRRELSALRTLVEIELQLEHLDFDNRWDFAAPIHLMKELLRGRPTANQQNVYSTFRQVWKDFGQEYPDPEGEQVIFIYHSLHYLKLKDSADRLHLAQAIAMEAAWFLTNDMDIIKKTRPEPAKALGKAIGIRQNVGIIQGVRVALPSECADRLAFHPVWGLIQKD